MDVTVDLSLNGMPMLFKEYQEKALRVVWDSEEGVISREVWEAVNKQMGAKENGREASYHKPSISRASIINFLNAMVDLEVLGYTERTGKGGYHRVYRPLMTEMELWLAVRGAMVQKFNALGIAGVVFTPKDVHDLAALTIYNPPVGGEHDDYVRHLYEKALSFIGPNWKETYESPE